MGNFGPQKHSKALFSFYGGMNSNGKTLHVNMNTFTILRQADRSQSPEQLELLPLTSFSVSGSERGMWGGYPIGKH